MDKGDFFALLLIVCTATVFIAAVGTTIVVNVVGWLRPKHARHTQGSEGGVG
jgi:hypothetical protein